MQVIGKYVAKLCVLSVFAGGKSTMITAEWQIMLIPAHTGYNLLILAGSMFAGSTIPSLGRRAF